MDSGAKLGQSKVINMEDYKYKRIMNKDGRLREFADRYEYYEI